ncbi:HD domain-containing protein [Candidatus Gracilibacteria bacterium]|nr:HD domain-containing protein [Candidatus Gracilibacteria bacterium]
MYKKPDNPLIEKSIKFLVKAVDINSKNPKPVILHSLRVAFLLNKLGYNDKIFIGVILHDVMEDAEVSVKEIKKEFGEEVSKMVFYNSFNKKIKDKRKRYIDMFNNCKKGGKNSLLIKAADIYDNSFYYGLADNKDSFSFLLEKLKYFIDLSKNELKNEKLYKILIKQYVSLCKNVS